MRRDDASVGARGYFAVTQESLAVPLKLDLRKWLLIVAAAFAVASMVISLWRFLINGDPTLGAFEGPLAVIGLILIGWNRDVHANPTATTRLAIAAIVVSALLLGMLFALPGNLTVRVLYAVAGLITIGTAIWKLSLH